MNRFGTRIAATMATAMALIVGGCATSNAPGPQSSDTSYSASPDPGGVSGFASPRDILERYPEILYGGP